MRLSRRGWNNVLIFAVIIFIAVLQLPTWFKHYFQPVMAPEEQALQHLLPADAMLERLNLPDVALVRDTAGGWAADASLPVPAAELAARWLRLAGTAVDEEMIAALKPGLGAPRSVEVWLVGQIEPLRLTVYQLPQFWLINNGQGRWLALSVEEGYLFPAATPLS